MLRTHFHQRRSNHLSVSGRWSLKVTKECLQEGAAPEGSIKASERLLPSDLNANEQTFPLVFLPPPTPPVQPLCSNRVWRHERPLKEEEELLLLVKRRDLNEREVDDYQVTFVWPGISLDIYAGPPYPRRGGGGVEMAGEHKGGLKTVEGWNESWREHVQTLSLLQTPTCLCGGSVCAPHRMEDQRWSGAGHVHSCAEGKSRDKEKRLSSQQERRWSSFSRETTFKVKSAADPPVCLILCRDVCGKRLIVEFGEVKTRGVGIERYLKDGRRRQMNSHVHDVWF